jgi:asparagine synthase (glutamine-hydrolysing)
MRDLLAGLDLQDVHIDPASCSATWGALATPPYGDALLLTATARRHERNLTPAEADRLILEERVELREVLPTFAAVARTPAGRTSVATDYLGFRHIYYGRREGTAVISTSSQVCAAALRTELDLEAVAVQSALGWQLGQRTLFTGVTKLAAGGIATLEHGDLALSSYLCEHLDRTWSLDDAVPAAAAVLRTSMATYVEEHPDAGLQLTGGQDSRLLLSAIPRPLRRGLRVVTLGVPGDADVDIASALAHRYGMRHELLSLDGLGELDPAEAYERCLSAARRVDFSTDPLAHAALTLAEERSEPGPRISGLGGEVARGFYNFGHPTSSSVTPRRAERLARWRMFVNEAVPTEALDPLFADRAREFATHEVARVLAGTARPWMVATDELYLGHRMQRWGGATETAVCLDREIVNPMLDDRFIGIATGLSPDAKRNSRFLSRLQLELDLELAALPLDDRPPPAAYAHRSLRNSVQLTTATAHKARRKIAQRARRQLRPPAGGEVLAAKVVSHWRQSPTALDSLRDLDVFREEWLDDLVKGQHQPPTSAVALVVNLVGATRAR